MEWAPRLAVDPVQPRLLKVQAVEYLDVTLLSVLSLSRCAFCIPFMLNILYHTRARFPNPQMACLRAR
jgi:hypothetical protein